MLFQCVPMTNFSVWMAHADVVTTDVMAITTVKTEKMSSIVVSYSSRDCITHVMSN